MTQYIVSVTAAAILAAILVSLAGRGTMGAMVKLLAGIFMALTVISPLMDLELPDPQDWFASYEDDALNAVTAGEEMADDALRTIIKQRTEAYILDKAARYDASLAVSVMLDENGYPAGVTLCGEISPYAKVRISQEIAAELGMKEEVQQWIR